jgi:hypothetical protein
VNPTPKYWLKLRYDIVRVGWKWAVRAQNTETGEIAYAEHHTTWTSKWVMSTFWFKRSAENCLRRRFL